MLIRTSAEIYLEEADKFLNKGDLVDACEKYYKATEDFLKYIAIVDNMSEILNQVNPKKLLGI
ncbi:MAG: PaREP1 family protein [Sulfolobaceae archaeon]|jgi:Archaeal PaREP1/PaREP8 family.